MLAILLAMANSPTAALAYLSTAPTGDRAWYWQNPEPQGNQLLDSAFVDENRGWAVGSTGTLLMTDSGGVVWEAQDPGVTSELRGVCFTDALNGWAVGVGGVIVNTDDGGITWQQQASGTTQTLHAVDFFDADSGLAVGANGTILRTTDGGSTWTAGTSGVTSILYGVSMASPTVAWTVGAAGVVRKTTNGGSAWSSQSSGVTVVLNSVSAISTTNAVAVGVSGNVIRTVNGGTTWSKPTSGTSSTIYDVSFATATRGWYVGDSGLAAVTSDGGATWTVQNAGTIGLKTVSACSADVAHAFGDYGTTVKTTDGGTTWQSSASGTTNDMYSVDFVDSQNGWAVGNAGTLLRSTDGGESWDTLSTGNVSLRGVQFYDELHGVAVGNSGRIITTDDGGLSWSTRTSGTTSNLWAVSYGSADTIWVTGDSGRILKSTDGGATWSAQSSGTTRALYAVDAVSDTTAWVVGASGTVKRTTNGSTWTTVSSGTNSTLRAVQAIDATHVYIAGSSGLIRYTANNGSSWATQTTGTTVTIYGLAFGTSQAGWFAGASGVIGATTNGGSSWSTQTSGTSSSLYAVCAADADTAWIVGAAGTVRHTSDGTTWHSLSYGTVANLNRVELVSDLNGWVVGAAGMLRHTNDGGITWRTLVSGTSNDLYGVAFTSASNGVIVGASGLIRSTANGGTTWTTRTTGVSQTLRDVDFFGTSTGIAVGDSGRILTTSNGGTSWTTRTSGTSSNLTSVHFLDATHAWAVGASGRIQFSSNAGQTWSSQTSGTSTNLTDVAFASATRGWAVGDSGVIRTTTNGGSSWSAQSSGTTNGLTSVSALDGSRVWVAGNAGTILKTVDGGAAWANRPTGVGTDLTSISMYGAAGWAVGDSGTTISTSSGTSPVTTAVVSPSEPDGESDWYTSPVLVMLQRDLPGITRYSTVSGAGPWSTYTSPVLHDDGIYNFHYYSVEVGGATESVKSVSFKVDTIEPSAPSVTASATSPFAADVTFSSSADAGSGVAYYEVHANGSLQTTTTANTAALSGLTPATVYAVSVFAVDEAGNRSAAGDAPAFVTLPLDDSPFVTTASVSPASPDGDDDWYRTQPQITLSADEDAQINFSWDSGSGPWSIYADALDAPSGLSTVYYYSSDPGEVRLDEDIASLSFKFDADAPSAPTGLVGYSPSPRSAQLAWDHVYDAVSGTREYRVELLDDGDWSQAGVTDDATIALHGLSAGSHTFRVRTVDNAGNVSSPSAAVEVEDMPESPADPPGLVGARAVGGGKVFVSWSEATSTVGAVTYHVWRSENGEPYLHIAEVDGTNHRSHVDNQALSSHAYNYKISVEDDRGEGDQSAPSISDNSAVSTHTQGPSAPLAVVAEALEDGSVSLRWTGAEVPNLAGYEVLRAQTQGGVGTTMTSEPTTATAFIDATTIGRPYERYWYRIVSVDDEGVAGESTVDAYVRTLGLVGGTTPHATFGGEDADNCGSCHSLHGSDEANHLLLEASATSLCDTCHDGTGAAKSTVNDIPQDGTGSSHGLGTRTDPGQMSCVDCHDPHFGASVGDMANLLASEETTGGVEFCYTCHGEDSTAPGGDMRAFSQTGHSHGVKAPKGTSDIACTVCHMTHGSASNALLIENADFTTCLQCHSPSGSSPDAPDKQFLFTSGSGSTAHLPMLEGEHEVTGSRMSCVNCHNAHRTTPNRPLVDPYAPNDVWTGTDLDFCLTCHQGDPLPTAAQVGSNIPAPLGAGGATTLTDIAASFLATDTAQYYSPHGVVSSTQSPDGHAARYLRPQMGYQIGDVLDCVDCHDQHGGANAFTLRGSVSSANGSKTQSGLVALKLPNDGGYDLRFFCSACHNMSDDEHPGGPLGTEPMDCTACHSHDHEGSD